MSTIALPARTQEQRREALRRANEVRIARAALKRQIRGGALHIIEVLADPPAAATGMHVRDLLLAQKFRGEARVRSLMNEVRISYGKTIGGLSSRQRDELIAAIARRPVKETA